MGDYFLCGAQLQAKITTFKPGHGVNNALLRAIFADSSNYRIRGGEPVMPKAAAKAAAVAHAVAATPAQVRR